MSDQRDVDIETAEEIETPDFEAFIEAVKAGAQPVQIVVWAEKMKKWAETTLGATETIIEHIRAMEEELSTALSDGEDNAKHVAALAQLIRDAKRRLSTGAEMLQYLEDHDLYGPEETQANIPFYGVKAA